MRLVGVKAKKALIAVDEALQLVNEQEDSDSVDALRLRLQNARRELFHALYTAGAIEVKEARHAS